MVLKSCGNTFAYDNAIIACGVILKNQKEILFLP